MFPQKGAVCPANGSDVRKGKLIVGDPGICIVIRSPRSTALSVSHRATQGLLDLLAEALVSQGCSDPHASAQLLNELAVKLGGERALVGGLSFLL